MWFVATTYNSSPRSGHELDAMRLMVSAASRLRRTGRTTPIAMVPWERDELAAATYWELGTAARAWTSHKAFGTA